VLKYCLKLKFDNCAKQTIYTNKLHPVIKFVNKRSNRNDHVRFPTKTVDARDLSMSIVYFHRYLPN